MSDFFTLNDIDRIADSIRERTKIQPDTAIILGSGLGSLAESVEGAVNISYSQLPSWPVSTVEGHMGRLVLGELESHLELVAQDLEDHALVIFSSGIQDGMVALQGGFHSDRVALPDGDVAHHVGEQEGDRARW